LSAFKKKNDIETQLADGIELQEGALTVQIKFPLKFSSFDI
jgi:hypothetical protein